MTPGLAALREVARGGDHFIWDSARIEDAADTRLFDPDWWRGQRRLTGEAAGRGAAYFLEGLDGTPWVLRHNRRGGLLAHVNHDRFIWAGTYHARALAEVRLLSQMRAERLPVPAPVAALAARRGPFYRGDVITERIADARPLADVLLDVTMPTASWVSLGAVVGRFHRAGIWHADMNARNVLVDSIGDFHLIDFDKARRLPPGTWQEPNLARLRRSLDKFHRQRLGFRFNAGDWAALRIGYAQVIAARSRGVT